jgi:hypothetical protein
MALDPRLLTADETMKLWTGGRVVIASKAYVMCRTCRKVVRADGFFGSAHLCLTDEEALDKHRRQIEHLINSGPSSRIGHGAPAQEED